MHCEPEQTFNIDLCVVPVTHDASQPFTSVSVSEAVAGAVRSPGLLQEANLLVLGRCLAIPQPPTQKR